MLLQASLGMEIDAPGRCVRFTNPTLPGFLDEVRITGLDVGRGSVDVAFERHGAAVDVRVLRRRGEIEVVSGQGFEP
jgi:hypothetical protein